MCGRYYVDQETEQAVWELTGDRNQSVRTGEIHPSEQATVLNLREQRLTAETMCWGFAGFKDNQLLINARAERVTSRPAFRESILFRRCVIPAKGFYEWTPAGELCQFEEEKGQLYLAGCYDKDQNFVILTTAANASVKPVHDRMPLLVSEEEIASWIADRDCMEKILQREPQRLNRISRYQQLDFFDRLP